MSLSDASCLPAHLKNALPLPLVAPLCCTPLVVHSGWLLCCLSSPRHLLPACASASHCTTASHCTPLAPLVRLVVASPLVTPPSPVCLSLRLSLHSHLFLCPSYASCPDGCCLTSCHAAAFDQLVHPPLIALLVWLIVVSPLVTPPPRPLIAPWPLIPPLLRLLSGWFLHPLLFCCHLLSICTFASQHTAAS